VTTSPVRRAASLGLLSLLACSRPIGSDQPTSLDASSPTAPDAVVDGTSEAPCPGPPDALFADPAGGPCAYRTLGEALAAAGAQGKRVLARGTFENEHFPLVVPAGVTLEQAPLASDRARIVFGGPTAQTAGEAIALGARAALVRIVVENRGGYDSAAAVSCATGPVTIREVELVGTGGGTTLGSGVLIGRTDNDDCSATIDRLTVRGFGDGLGALAGEGLPSSIGASTFEDNATGMTITTARVTMSGVAIRGTPNGVARVGLSIYADAQRHGAVVEVDRLSIDDMATTAIDIGGGRPDVEPRVFIEAGAISGSGGDAIRMTGGLLDLTGSRILNSGGHGVAMAGGELRLAGVDVVGSGAAGVVIDRGLEAEARVRLESVQVHGNQLGAGETVGGILFAGPATLVGFAGNRIFANAGHQLGFAARPTVGDTWTLGTPGCDATGMNRIHCYAPGHVGIFISSALPTVVEVQGTAWPIAAPVPTSDWLSTGSGGNAVRLIDQPCPPVSACP